MDRVQLHKLETEFECRCLILFSNKIIRCSCFIYPTFFCLLLLLLRPIFVWYTLGVSLYFTLLISFNHVLNIFIKFSLHAMFLFHPLLFFFCISEEYCLVALSFFCSFSKEIQHFMQMRWQKLCAKQSFSWASLKSLFQLRLCRQLILLYSNST